MHIRKCVGWLLTACLLAISSYAQDAGKFAGTWKGEHAGKTYIELSIASGTPLKITVTTAVIHLDKLGAITAVDGKVEHTETVLGAKIVAGRLQLRTKQENGGIVEYEMTLEGDRNASLAIRNVSAKVQPFRLQRS